MRTSHMEALAVQDELNALKDGQPQHPDVSVKEKQLADLRGMQKQLWKENIVPAICAAFMRSNTEGNESGGISSPPEAVTTPMELLSLVVWQSEKQGLKVAQQCLQALQEQLNIGDDRPLLLEWLARVRTFSLDDSTGQLLMDPNNQWMSLTVSAVTASSDLSLSAANGQRKCADPPALLMISSMPSPGVNAPRGHSDYDSERADYHLLQLVHQPQDSPLHPRFTSSLSRLILSPMLPFISEDAWADAACRLFFLPVLHFQRSVNHPQSPSAVPQPMSSSSTSTASESAISDSVQSELPLQLRCGEAVTISPQLCTQLGSRRQRPERGTGQAAVPLETDSQPASQVMTFFGALLMAGSQASGAGEPATAEVWALLSDSLDRWWVYRVDLSSPSVPMHPCLTGEQFGEGDGILRLWNLLGPTAEHFSDEVQLVPPIKWRLRCHQIWTAVLSWLRFAQNCVVSQQTGLLQEAQRTEEEEEVEEEDSSAPRRSSRSHALVRDDSVQAPANGKGRKRKKVEEEMRGEGKAAINKSKAEAKAQSAAKKQKEKEKLAAKREADRQQEKRREKARVSRQKASEKERRIRVQQEKKEMREKKQKEEKKVKKMKIPTPSTEEEAQHSTEGGVRTRKSAAKTAPAIIATKKQPAPLTAAAVSSRGKGRGRKRKGMGSEETGQAHVTVECGDVERKSTKAADSTYAALLATAVEGVSTEATHSGMSSVPSTSSSTPHSVAAVDDMVLDIEADESVGPSANVRSASGPPTLWHLYLTGDKKHLVEGHREQVYAWFNSGLHNGPKFLWRHNQDLRGPNVDILAEWDFLRVTRVTGKVLPNDVTPLDRTKMPAVDRIAQCFVASVGFHNSEVQEGYFKAVKTHHMLTDAFALQAKGRPAQHAKLPFPWVAYKGITLTTSHGVRLDVEGNLIDRGTPSYPPGTFPDLDAFRLVSGAQFVGRGESSRSARKKVKTEAAGALGNQGRCVDDDTSSHVSISSESELGMSAHRSLVASSDARLAAQLREQLAQVEERMRTQNVMDAAAVPGPSSSRQSPVSVSHRDVALSSSSPRPSSDPHPFPIHSSDAAPSSNASMQLAASPSSANTTALIPILATSTSSANRSVPPIRTLSSTMMAATPPPVHRPAVHHEGTLRGSYGDRLVAPDMVSTDVMRKMLDMQAQVAAQNALTEQSGMAAVQEYEESVGRNRLLLSINQERMTKGWKSLPQLPHDLRGDRLGEKEFSDLSLPRYAFRAPGVAGHSTIAEVAYQPNYTTLSAAVPLPSFSSPYSLRSSSPPIMSFNYHQAPYGPFQPSHPHHSHSTPPYFSYPLRAPQSVQSQQYYSDRM